MLALAWAALRGGERDVAAGLLEDEVRVRDFGQVPAGRLTRVAEDLLSGSARRVECMGSGKSGSLSQCWWRHSLQKRTFGV